MLICRPRVRRRRDPTSHPKFVSLLHVAPTRSQIHVGSSACRWQRPTTRNISVGGWSCPIGPTRISVCHLRAVKLPVWDPAAFRIPKVFDCEQILTVEIRAYKRKASNEFKGILRILMLFNSYRIYSSDENPGPFTT